MKCPSGHDLRKYGYWVYRKESKDGLLSILFYEDFFLQVLGERVLDSTLQPHSTLSILFYEDFFLQVHQIKKALDLQSQIYLPFNPLL